MNYRFLTIHDRSEPDGDGLLTPVPTGDGLEVLSEPADGKSVVTLTAKGLTIRAVNAKKAETELSDVEIALRITDSRITFACSKWAKGGGWVGDPISMAVLNTASKVRAARTRRGRVLVGQVRYPWLVAAYAQNAAGFKYASTLRLRLRDGETSYFVEFALHKNDEATHYATEVIRRCAAFRLAAGDATPEYQERFEAHRAIEELQWAKGSGQMAGRTFPTSWPVSRNSPGIDQPSTTGASRA